MTLVSVLNIIATVIIFALFGLFIFAVVRIIRKGITVEWIAVALLSLGLNFFIYLAYYSQEIRPVDWAQILLLLALVGVAGFYALSAHKQADASAKMADEMREQRYDTVRPVIDIEKEESPQAEIAQGLAVRDGVIGIGLPCKLHNIGLGPATDLYSFIRDDQNIRRRFDFGTLATRGKTVTMGLYVNKEENNRISAYYRDIYGRAFESSREVIIDKEKGSLEFGPLTIRPVEEDKQ